MLYSIPHIVKRSIKQIKCYHNITTSDEHLVLLTWLMESTLDETYHQGNPTRHGYLRLSKDEFRVLLFDHIRIRQKMCDDIKKIAMIDVREHTLDELFEALMYNVAFQAIVTWCFYHSKLKEMPKDIREVANTYFLTWKKWDTVVEEDIDEAVEMLVEFLNEVK